MRNENLFLRDYKKDQIKKDLRELLKRSKHDGKEKRLEIADKMKSQILPRLDDPKIDISEADGDIIKDSLSVYRDIQAYDLMVRQASKTSFCISWPAALRLDPIYLQIAILKYGILKGFSLWAREKALILASRC